ncbi:PRC-barrel domain containing protein [Natrononativus amylolyticus]|uniref:PRC-barrel domain containing protein n=1 Tax=Natrononativus amylolyticus TaxID=2963434 RepID=UPI0020CD2CE0|nr:PRC-barrel domain containing protein [Natrononativus amylolyticus]
MTDRILTEADEGKRVLNVDGTAVGRIVEVTDGRGYVVADPTVLETIKARLGWGDVTAEAHPLDEGSIEEITDDAVRLRGTL